MTNKLQSNTNTPGEFEIDRGANLNAPIHDLPDVHGAAARRRAEEALLPRLVKDGFNRDDVTKKYEREQQEHPHPLGDKFLHGDSVPTVGQVAKVHVNLERPMKGNFGGQTTWFLMTGLVVEVLDRWRVRAELTTSTDNAPPSFYATWDVVLTYDGTYTCPWMLVSMRRLPEDKGNPSAR
jgi:hypothetical protein